MAKPHVSLVQKSNVEFWPHITFEFAQVLFLKGDYSPIPVYDALSYEQIYHF